MWRGAGAHGFLWQFLLELLRDPSGGALRERCAALADANGSVAQSLSLPLTRHIIWLDETRGIFKVSICSLSSSCSFSCSLSYVSA